MDQISGPALLLRESAGPLLCLLRPWGLSGVEDPTVRFCPGSPPRNDWEVFRQIGGAIVRSIASVDTTTKYGAQNWPINDVLINEIYIEN